MTRSAANAVPRPANGDATSAARIAHPQVLFRRSASLLSPLRYPGSKRRLAGFVRACIELNGLRPDVFIEPFAGGASVSLQLLASGVVQRIGLADRDRLVASFWQTVFHDHEWLIDRVRKLKPSVDLWVRMRASRPDNMRGQALKCLLLNRTSFSGILASTAGPIGGVGQKSDYAIDCRWPVETLVKRIEAAAQYSQQVEFIRCATWQETMRLVRSRHPKGDGSLLYLDPPFFNNADRLYTHSFREHQHRQLRDAVGRLRRPFILSYDKAPFIDALYARSDGGRRRSRGVELVYTASSKGTLRIARELIVTNLPRLPTRTRLWRPNRLWRPSRA